MGDLIYLSDYRSIASDFVIEGSAVKILESKPNLNKALTLSPIFYSEDTLYLVRNKLSQFFEKYERDTLIMPFTKDLEPYWVSDIERAWFNYEFFPYTVLHCVLRDYPMEFIQMVDGICVDSSDYHRELVDDFNKIYMRALKNKGGGFPKGTLSEDEFIRLASTFYILLMSSNLTLGLDFNGLGLVQNKWNGRPKISETQ